VTTTRIIIENGPHEGRHELPGVPPPRIALALPQAPGALGTPKTVDYDREPSLPTDFANGIGGRYRVRR
jgi:hypothetical protein